MGEARRKRDAATISVLVPVRGRPVETMTCLRSLLETAADDSGIEIILAVDDDDEAASPLCDPSYGGDLADPRVRVLVWPRPDTLGAKLNAMAREAAGEILWFIANDYIMATPCWPDEFRRETAKMPNRIGVLYPRDAVHPDHAAFPLVTREMEQLLDGMFPTWFPYWFIDTWWDEIGIVLGLKREIPCEVRHQGERGGTHAMIDLEFWATVFEELRPMRLKQAFCLGTAAWGEGSANLGAMMAAMNARANLCAQRVAHLRHPGFVERWEARAASPPSAAYPRVKAAAEALLVDFRAKRPHVPRVMICVPSQSTWCSRTALDVAALMDFSSKAGLRLAIVNHEGSMITQLRNAITETALRENADYLFWIDSDMRFPPDALVRLLGHNKDIVGATYNKKVAPYETLGRFAGDRPEAVDANILHEALLLPGGMMLVKAEVYRKLKFPMYFESYHWPGEDGFASFCEMARHYWFHVPPEEALEELRETKFGRWIKTHFEIGEGQRALYFSEDLSWCRKARRAGFSIWCDLKLTNECRHIGQIEVTALLPATETAPFSDQAPS
ncbi:MAG TPA: glycosyltransferase [Stellaceae bacterium]|nr:glycosyltransferase [Stellaceae bacterium]